MDLDLNIDFYLDINAVPPSYTHLHNIVQWLFVDRISSDIDDLMGYYTHLRREKKYNLYKKDWDIFKAYQKDREINKILEHVQACDITGSTAQHVDWANRIRNEYFLKSDHYALVLLLASDKVLKLTSRSHFWVNMNKCTAIEIEKKIFTLSGLFLDSKSDDKYEAKLAYLDLLNGIYSL